MNFSSAQKAAIEHDKGPLLIIAGAGTGKTRVITHRIADLISTKKARPHEILALTFTEKAASEMEERIDLLTPYGYTDTQILTFHAFGDQLLREFGIRIGLSPDFRVLSKPEQIVFFRQNLFAFPLHAYRPLGNPTKHIESILTHISRAKDEDIDPSTYQSYADVCLADAALHPDDPTMLQEAKLQKELAGTYQIYQRLLLENQSIDFGDQVFLALSMLRQAPALLQRLPYRYILVDEFQDTNSAQFKLVQLLVQQGAEITVVGDDDQSIYKFRGAAISNIQQFTQIYPNARRVVLNQNFRSRQTILDAAYRLIQQNNPHRLEVIEKVNKRLQAEGYEQDDPTETVAHRHFDTTATEADWVAKTIAETMTKEKRYGDFAILVRTNAASDPYIRALNMLGIPNRFTGNRGLFHREEIRLMLSFMRVVVDPHDSASLYFLLTSDLYRYPIGPLSQLMTTAKRTNRSLYTLLEAAEEGIESSPPETERLSTEISPHPIPLPLGEEWGEGRTEASLLQPFKQLKNDLDRALSRSRDVDAGVVLYEYLHKNGLFKYPKINTAEDDLIIKNISRFFGEIKRICQWTKMPSLHNVVASLDLLLAAGEDPPTAEADLSDDAVSILTVHRAKGLEFHTVFMVGVHDGGFPTRNRGEALPLPTGLLPETTGNLHIEEERRLFYVGMTRAKEKLVLTSAQHTRSTTEGGSIERIKKVSPFVVEALDLPHAPRPGARGPRTYVTEKIQTKNQHLLEVMKEVPSAPAVPQSVPAASGLNYYKIDDYLTCPLKYKYIHILGVPIYPHHTIVYGNAIHKAIAVYLKSKQEQRGISPDEILQVFEGAWRSEGYLSREHEERRLEAGRRALLRLYEEEEQSDVCTTYIEKDFSLSFEGIKIKGRWDRIDGATIIDYKTSDVTDQEIADKKARESMQLTLYAWAYREHTGFLPERVSLYFVDSGMIGTAVKEEKDIEKLKEKIRQVHAGIVAGDFSSRPTYMACSYCAYQNICPYTASQK